MQKLLLCGLFFLALVISYISAQENEYRLREPSIEDYFSILDEVIGTESSFHILSQYETYPLTAVTMVDEISWRF